MWVVIRYYSAFLDYGIYNIQSRRFACIVDAICLYRLLINFFFNFSNFVNEEFRNFRI